MNIATKININKLPNLCCDLSEIIYQNRVKIEKMLDNKGLLGATSKKSLVIDTEECDQIYNNGISDNEKRAWVLYKLSIGNPMHGWEKYYPPNVKKGDVITQMVTAKNDLTNIYDKNHRVIKKLDKDAIIGRYYSSKNFKDIGEKIICKDTIGDIVYVDVENATIHKSTVNVQNDYIQKLIMDNVLFINLNDGDINNADYVPYSIYIQGNLYEKAQLYKDNATEIIAKFGEQIYQNHIKILEMTSDEYHLGAKPKPKYIENPDQNNRPFISYKSKFAQNFKINNVRDEFAELYGKVRTNWASNGKLIEDNKSGGKKVHLLEYDANNFYSLTHIFSYWIFTLKEQDFSNKKINASKIYHYALLNGRLIQGDVKDTNNKKEQDRKTHLLKSLIQVETENLFQRFLKEVLTPEDQIKLNLAWNKEFNAYALNSYARVPLMFKTSRYYGKKDTKGNYQELKLKPIQLEALRFIENKNSGVISLDVGGGKTMCLILSIIMGLQQGRFKRPLLVVPKAVYKQFCRDIVGNDDDFMGVLSNCGYEVNFFDNFSSLKKQKMVKENSISICTIEGMLQLALSTDNIKKYTQQFYEILDPNIKDKSNQNLRNEVKEKDSLTAKLCGSRENTKFDFEKFGFDSIFADEAHNYKNLIEKVNEDDSVRYAATPEGETYEKNRYLLTGAQSIQALRFFMFVGYINFRYGNNIVLATATPFTKAILEIFSLLVMVDYKGLKECGLNNVNTFCDTFIEKRVEYVATQTNTLELKEVIKNFKNTSILKRFIQNNILYRNRECFKDSGIKLPCLINIPYLNYKEDGIIKRLPPEKQITVYLEMSDLQMSKQEKIVEDINQAKEDGYNLAMLKAINYSKANAFSPYMGVNGDDYYDFSEFIEGSPKVNACCLTIKGIKDYCQKEKIDMPGQIIFSTMGNKYFGDIKKHLMNICNFKSKEVEIIDSKTPDTERLRIQDNFNDGICKVIIGSETISEGLNLQQNASDIHIINSDWNPTTLVQLAGRIHRQGNKRGYVRFINYLLKNSIDVPMYQKNDEKIARINELLTLNSGEAISGEYMDPNEVKYALITNVQTLTEMDFEIIYNEERDKILNRKEEVEFYDKAMQIYSERGKYLNEILHFFENFKYHYQELLTTKFEYIAQPNETKEQYQINKKREKERWDKKIATLTEIISNIDNSRTFTDKEVLKLRRTIREFYLKNQIVNGVAKTWRDFTDSPREYQDQTVRYTPAFSKFKKLEGFLDTKGYKITDDLGEIYRNEKASYENELLTFNLNFGISFEENLDFSNYRIRERVEKSIEWTKCKDKVLYERGKLNIKSKTPEEAAETICKTNDILKYTIFDRPCGDDCELPIEVFCKLDDMYLLKREYNILFMNYEFTRSI